MRISRRRGGRRSCRSPASAAPATSAFPRPASNTTRTCSAPPSGRWA